MEMENEPSIIYRDLAKKKRRNELNSVKKMTRQQETTKLVELEINGKGRHHANPFPRPSGQG
jgi:hypothetical protein